MYEKFKRSEWFRHDRFGLFIHWGLYAIPSRGEWVSSTEKMTDEDYQRYFNEFNPSDYNPKEWAKIAKEAGMKYAVMTAKHHDGFCLFDSKYTDFKSTNAPCGRDLVREFLDAFRAEGLKVGLYYSLLDWNHPAFPAYQHPFHPRTNDESYKEREPFENYLKYMHSQVEELCSSYGKIDIMWFDFSYGDMTGEKWGATKLVNMVRSYLPDIVLDNRLEVSGQGLGSLATENPSVYSGDFVSPEHIIPPDCILNELGEPIPWESCFTLNDHWGYCANDNNYKDESVVIRKLAECVSKSGNMLLNVGRGTLHRQKHGGPARGWKMDEKERKLYIRLYEERIPEARMGTLYAKRKRRLRAGDRPPRRPSAPLRHTQGAYKLLPSACGRQRVEIAHRRLADSKLQRHGVREHSQIFCLR